MAHHHHAHSKPQVIQGNFQGRQPAFVAQAKPGFTHVAQQQRAPHVRAVLQQHAPTHFTAQRDSGPQPQTAPPSRIGNAFRVPPPVNLAPPSQGRPLPDTVRQKMESFFNTDFSDVRVHVGAQAKSIGAVAFTMGSQIHFAPGQYNPNTTHGQRLLGHELTHVVQQRAGRVRNPFGGGVAVVQDPGMEAEADRMGIQAAAYRVPVQTKLATTPMLYDALPNEAIQCATSVIQPTRVKVQHRKLSKAEIKRRRQKESLLRMINRWRKPTRVVHTHGVSLRKYPGLEYRDIPSFVTEMGIKFIHPLREAVNEIGEEHGCWQCGRKMGEAGAAPWTADHIPPYELPPRIDGPLRKHKNLIALAANAHFLFWQCKNCSSEQSALVKALARGKRDLASVDAAEMNLLVGGPWAPVGGRVTTRVRSTRAKKWLSKIGIRCHSCGTNVSTTDETSYVADHYPPQEYNKHYSRALIRKLLPKVRMPKAELRPHCYVCSGQQAIFAQDASTMKAMAKDNLIVYYG